MTHEPGSGAAYCNCSNAHRDSQSFFCGNKDTANQHKRMMFIATKRVAWAKVSRNSRITMTAAKSKLTYKKFIRVANFLILCTMVSVISLHLYGKLRSETKYLNEKFTYHHLHRRKSSNCLIALNTSPESSPLSIDDVPLKSTPPPRLSLISGSSCLPNLSRFCLLLCRRECREPFETLLSVAEYSCDPRT